MSARLPGIETVDDPRRATVLIQHPVRRRILAEAREPVSATELGARLGQPRQRLNYHVKQLAGAGFLEPAGRRMKGNLEERTYRATARAYVLVPQLLGPVAASAGASDSVRGAGHLLALTSVAQQELADLAVAESGSGVRVVTVSLNSEIRFASAERREAFSRELLEAVRALVALHADPPATSPGDDDADRADAGGADNNPGATGLYRLILGCYPVARAAGDAGAEASAAI